MKNALRASITGGRLDPDIEVTLAGPAETGACEVFTCYVSSSARKALPLVFHLDPPMKHGRAGGRHYLTLSEAGASSDPAEAGITRSPRVSARRDVPSAPVSSPSVAEPPSSGSADTGISF